MGCQVFLHVKSCLIFCWGCLSSFEDFECSSEVVVGKDYVVKEATLSNAVYFGVGGYGVGAYVVFLAVDDEGQFIQQFACVSLCAAVEKK